MAKRRTVAVASILSALATMIVLSYQPAGAATAQTFRGVIGADVHASAGACCDDWGALASIGGRAKTRIQDVDVAVVDDQAPPGVTSSDEGDVNCAGTFKIPTAPPDKVCIYVSNGDNATDVHGVSVVPGAGGSKFGFKIVWSTPTDDADSFVEAVWAYQRPAS
jgi:hypothetical protein